MPPQNEIDVLSSDSWRKLDQYFGLSESCFAWRRRKGPDDRGWPDRWLRLPQMAARGRGWPNALCFVSCPAWRRRSLRSAFVGRRGAGRNGRRRSRSERHCRAVRLAEGRNKKDHQQHRGQRRRQRAANSKIGVGHSVASRSAPFRRSHGVRRLHNTLRLFPRSEQRPMTRISGWRSQELRVSKRLENITPRGESFLASPRPTVRSRFRLQRNGDWLCSVHARVRAHFNQERHLVARHTYKQRRSAAPAEWRAVMA